MALHSEIKERISHLHPETGWVVDSPGDVPGARIRVRSEAKIDTNVLITNEMFAPNYRGGWNNITGMQESELQGFERGYVFTVKSRQTPQGTFWRIEPMRYVDSGVVERFLVGLTVCDAETLQPIAVELIADAFSLPHEQYGVFASRVAQANGQLVEAQADTQAMAAKYTQLTNLISEMERLCVMSRGVIDQIAGGVTTQAPDINDRSAQMRQLRQRGIDLAKEIKAEHVNVEKSGASLEFVAWSQKLVEATETAVTILDRLHQEHHSYENQALERIKSNITIAGPDTGPLSVRYLMIPVFEYFTRLGYDCRLVENGINLTLGEHVVELTASPRIVTVGRGGQDLGAASGSPAATRGEREL